MPFAMGGPVKMCDAFCRIFLRLAWTAVALVANLIVMQPRSRLVRPQPSDVAKRKELHAGPAWITTWFE